LCKEGTNKGLMQDGRGMGRKVGIKEGWCQTGGEEEWKIVGVRGKVRSIVTGEEMYREKSEKVAKKGCVTTHQKNAPNWGGTKSSVADRTKVNWAKTGEGTEGKSKLLS